MGKTKDELTKKFGKIINYMSCVYLNDGEGVLRYFMEKCKPKNIIEIGTYQGVSAAVMAQYADSVNTFDVVDLPLRTKIFNHLKIKNVTFNLVKDNEEKRQLIKELFKTKEIDFCFIDGEHYRQELENDFDMCKDCKNILVHDYSPDFHEVYDFCNFQEGYEKETKISFMLLTKQNDSESIKEEKPKKRRRRKKDGMFE